MMVNLDKLYTPLPCLNQDGRPDCVLETRANITNAFMRMWEGHHTAYDEFNCEWKDVDACAYIAHTPLGERTIVNGSCRPGWKSPVTPAEIKAKFDTNGVLETGVPSRARSFVRAWNRGWVPRMPVIKPYKDDGPALVDHDVLMIGYKKTGIITLNSWGKQFGHNGRVILSWEFVARYKMTFLEYSYDGRAVDSWRHP